MRNLALIPALVLALAATAACRSPVRTQAAGMLAPIDPPVEQPGQPDLDATPTPDATDDALDPGDATLGDVVKPPTPARNR